MGYTCPILYVEYGILWYALLTAPLAADQTVLLYMVPVLPLGVQYLCGYIKIIFITEHGVVFS
jgi:hypothetical protein